MQENRTIIGIHNTLFIYTFIVTILGILLTGMGGLFVANVLHPEARFMLGEVRGMSSKIALVGFGSLFLVFGAFIAIYTPLRSLKSTRVVLHQIPKDIEVKLIENAGSDGSSLWIAFQDKHYLAKHPAWFQQVMLEQPLGVKAYFDSSGELTAIALDEGLIWTLNLSNPFKPT